MYCISFCVGKEINLVELEKEARAYKEYAVTKYKNILVISILDEQHLFFFENGTLITWNLKRYECEQWLFFIQRFTVEPLALPDVVQDEFSYIVSDNTNIKPHQTFNIDCLTLEEDTESIKLSISYGLSQSIKLNYYEARLERLIASALPMMEVIQKKSFKKISKRSLHRAIALQLIEKSELNLISNFHYQPSFFWQHPTLESYYHLIEEYLDIKKRVTTLNKRLDVLNEIHDMVLSYNETLHSSRLEIIIIILLVIEIIFGVLNFHF